MMVVSIVLLWRATRIGFFDKKIYLQACQEENGDTKSSVGVEPTRSHPLWQD